MLANSLFVKTKMNIFFIEKSIKIKSAKDYWRIIFYPYISVIKRALLFNKKFSSVITWRKYEIKFLKLDFKSEIFYLYIKIALEASAKICITLHTNTPKFAKKSNT